MQYILTEEEHEKLVPKKQLQESKEALEVARRIIVRHGTMQCGEDYCDYCPISDIGEDLITEGRPNHEVSRLICTLPRRYGK